MSVGDVESIGTIKLQRDFVSCYKKHDRTLEATLLNPIIWFRKGKIAERLFEKGKEIKDVLADRYEGVMLQMFNRADAATATLIKSTWFLAQRRVLTLSDARRFAEVLWDSFLEQTMADISLLEPLKPKFMLRQFVDEIDEDESRTALRIIAYSSEPLSVSNRESFTLFQQALPFLHQQLTNHSKELEILTDGVITFSDVQSFHSPYEQYRNWLLRA
jgi:hypothetical protein